MIEPLSYYCTVPSSFLLFVDKQFDDGPTSTVTLCVVCLVPVALHYLDYIALIVLIRSDPPFLSRGKKICTAFVVLWYSSLVTRLDECRILGVMC